MKTAPVSTTKAPHYQWGEGCDGWHLVRTESLSVIQERMPSGTAEQRHKHSRARQFFFVLRGELTLEIDGEEHVLAAESGVEVLPGTPHQAFNRSNDDTWFLVTSQPPSHGDRIDA